MSPPDLLLINPGGRVRIYQDLGKSLAAKETPIWVGLLAEFARRKGHHVEILDADALDLGPEQAAAEAVARGARLTAMVVYGHNPNASTQVMPTAGDTCRAFKELAPEAPLLLLGGHVAALPERSLAEEAADFVSDGEGPHTIHELLQALEAGGGPELRKVRDLLYEEEGQVIRTAPAPLVTDLEAEMPSMAWDLLDLSLYRAHNWHCFGGRTWEPYAAIYTTLGCPFRCSFCCIQAPFKTGESALGYKPNVNSYRRWSPANIVGQIDRLVRDHGVRNLKFADELFVLHKEHVRAISEGLIALGHDLNIWAYARVDTCNDQALLETMARAGFRWLAIGIESASESVRADVDKGYKPEAILATVDRVRDAGLHVLGNYMFGLPEDDLASMRLTLDVAKELNTEYANFFSAMAYPGSALYKEALHLGLELPETWQGYSQHSACTKPLPTRHLSGAEVLAFRDAAFVEYFDRPEYQAHVERIFGEEARGEVEAMLAHPLPRQLLGTAR